eukprot:8347363-Ditylum_brightwellii.AAC.1
MALTMTTSLQCNQYCPPTLPTIENRTTEKIQDISTIKQCWSISFTFNMAKKIESQDKFACFISYIATKWSSAYLSS